MQTAHGRDIVLAVPMQTSVILFRTVLAVTFASALTACAPERAPATAPAGASVTSGAPKGASRHEAIEVPGFTAAKVPISQVVRVGDLVYLSGQVAADPGTGQMPEGLEAQTEQIFKNASRALAAAGLDLSHVFKCNVYMTNIADFPAFNEVYARHFSKPYPARTTVGVAGLPRGAVLEIEMVAR